MNQNPKSPEKTESEQLVSQVQVQTSLVCLLSFGLSFLEATAHDFESYGLVVKIAIVLGILLVSLWASEKFSLVQKLSNVTSTRFSRNGILYIIITELVVGNLVYYGIRCLVLVFRGGEISCINVLSIYLLVFSMYHNGEFMFVLWCHTQDTSWKSKRSPNP